MTWLKTLWRLIALLILWILAGQEEEPEGIRILSKREIMPNKMGYTLGLPTTPSAIDVQKNRLVATQDGEEVLNEVFDFGAAPPEVIVAQDSEVVISLYEIDDAGNESPEPKTLEFTAVDDIPPGTPGEFQVLSHREIPEETPPEEPEDEEPPVE